MAEEKHLKDVISVISITLAESVAYPLTTALTRVQARTVRMLNPQRGFPPFAGGMSLCASSPAFFLRMVMSDALFPYFHETQGYGVVFSYALTSLVSDAFACAIRTPAEIYRQQFQTAATNSTKDLLTNVLGHHGPLGLWRGFTIFYLREVVFNTGRTISLLVMQERQRNE